METNPTSIHEDFGSITGPTQGVKDTMWLSSDVGPAARIPCCCGCGWGQCYSSYLTLSLRMSMWSTCSPLKKKKKGVITVFYRKTMSKSDFISYVAYEIFTFSWHYCKSSVKFLYSFEKWLIKEISKHWGMGKSFWLIHDFMLTKTACLWPIKHTVYTCFNY